MNIDQIWNNILSHEGEKFYTKKGHEFTYSVINDFTILPFSNGKDKWPITKNTIDKVLIEYPLLCGEEFNRKITASSYIAGILLDKRIR